MTDATEGQLRLARKCAAKYWQTGDPGDEATASRILSGEWDDQAYTQAALRAIQETTDRAAKMAGWAHMVPPDGGSPTAEETQLAASIASGLRSFAHLKGQS